MKKSIGLQFVSLNNEIITKKIIEDFNQIVFNWFKIHKVLPTYWGIDGKGFSKKLTKFSLKKLSNLKEKKEFLDKDKKLIHGLSYYFNPKDSDSPAFDSFLNIGISYTDYSTPTFVTKDKKMVLHLIINPNNFIIENHEIGTLIKEFITIFEVDYGMVYMHEDYEHVSAEIIEYDDGKYIGKKAQREDWWYTLSNEEKLKNFRDIYPINIFNKKYYAEIVKDLIVSYDLISIKLDDDKLTCIIQNDYIEYCLSQRPKP